MEATRERWRCFGRRRKRQSHLRLSRRRGGKLNNAALLDQATELDNAQHLLLPGQFVRVRLLGLTHPGAILVPQRAVQQGLGGAFVYVLDGGDKVATRDVIATAWDGGSWLIARGLAAGDRVVVDGLQQVAPGSPVRAVAYQPAADSSAARSTP